MSKACASLLVGGIEVDGERAAPVNPYCALSLQEWPTRPTGSLSSDMRRPWSKKLGFPCARTQLLCVWSWKADLEFEASPDFLELRFDEVSSAELKSARDTGGCWPTCRDRSPRTPIWTGKRDPGGKVVLAIYRNHAKRLHVESASRFAAALLREGDLSSKWITSG